MQQVTAAKVLLDEEGFNEMPSRKEILGILKELQLPIDGKTGIVDGSKAYWQNASDTLVLTISKNSMSEVGIAVADFLHRTGPDEFHYETAKTAEGYVTICRFWWD